MILVVMGPAGAGKLTIGRALADAVGWPFVDADAFHSDTNVEKMRRGEALSDDDRLGWLQALHDVIAESARKGAPLVLACSALTRRHRDVLAGITPGVVFVYLRVPESVLHARLTTRLGHFADARLLPQQLAALEEPDEAWTVDATRDPGAIVRDIRDRLGL